MKTLILKGSVLVLSLMLAWSCIKPDQTSTLTVSPVTISFSATAGEKTFTVKSTESWAVEKPADAGWLTVYRINSCGTTPVNHSGSTAAFTHRRARLFLLSDPLRTDKRIYVGAAEYPGSKCLSFVLWRSRSFVMLIKG
jgi:hypothetical protein